MRDTVSKFEFAVTCKSIQDQGKVLIALYITGTFEEFVQNGTYDNA